jgi:hypothetical protein
VPFCMLSNGALHSVERGCYCEAVVKQQTLSCKTFYIQSTTWKEKKQVMFLHTTDVGASEGHTVNRSTKGVHECSVLKAPRAQLNYAKHFNAIDYNDRNSADYTTSIRTNRWYLRVFFWALDWVVHVLFVMVLFCVRSGIGPDYWKLYATKHGRYEFQIDLECQS